MPIWTQRKILWWSILIRGIRKRIVRFQMLTRNLFLTSHRHNVRNPYHTDIFGMSNSLLALATDSRGIRWNASHPLSMSSSDTRSRQGLFAFTQASIFHKPSVPPSYVITARCVLSKPCTKFTLHCHRQMLWKFSFWSNPTTCPCGLRGPPSWAWQQCNRLLRVGRPWDAVTLSGWCEWWYRRM